MQLFWEFKVYGILLHHSNTKHVHTLHVYTGPLLVADSSYAIENTSNVNISWSLPFTLPGVPIIGYNVTVIVNDSTTQYFTQSNSIVVHKNQCDEMIVIVAGYNTLNGSNSSLHGKAN